MTVRKRNKWAVSLITVLLCTFFLSLSVQADMEEAIYRDPDTGYGIALVDDAALFTEEEEVTIMAEMLDFLEFGNAMVATTGENPFSGVQALAIDYYDRYFGTEQGAIFIIDMADREIFWYTEGDLYKSLSIKSAMAITDNVYTYAVDGDYAGCCEEAFSQAVTILHGGIVMNKMKYAGNALLALILAVLLNYAYARKTSFIRPEVKEKEKLYTVKQQLMYEKHNFIREVVTQIPKRQSTSWGSSYSGSSYGGSSYSGGSSSWSSGSSSHSSSSSSSRSSSSSGHSGGGAGHRF